MNGKSKIKLNLFFILFGISLITFLYFLFDGVALPYVGPNATNFNVYSLIAHNFNKFGYIETKFAPVISVSSELPPNPSYFFHHPTLLSFVESLLFKVFGESFWVGRLTVIIFTLGSVFLIFLIGKTLLGKKYGIFSTLIMLLVPATAIFGKMIGQEPLVLFFGLLTLYSVLKYLNSSNKKFLFIASFSIILGVLSDWPMAYFILCFIPLFIKYKKTKVGIYFVLLSFLTIIILLSYVYIMESGFWDLQNALAHRTVTGLLGLSFWPLRWIATTFFRLTIYFNPVFFIFSIITLWNFILRIKNRKFSDIDLTILGLFLFGALHLIIYAEASFTHPYLIYYLVPFIVLGSSRVILNFSSKKQYIYLVVIISFSLFYLFLIGMYKREQVLSNLWRYELIFKIRQYVPLYDEVILNRGSVIDTDLLWYPFLINWQFVDAGISSKFLEQHNNYIYSCSITCDTRDSQLTDLKKKYKFVHILSPNAEAYIFYLKNDLNYSTVLKSESTHQISKDSLKKDNEHLKNIKNLYRLIRSVLKVPQI